MGVTQRERERVDESCGGDKQVSFAAHYCFLHCIVYHLRFITSGTITSSWANEMLPNDHTVTYSQICILLISSTWMNHL
uniref:Uncharacterized protein n=1 Tax=Cyclopterus lumpus TaxID=8103 RepID=A0A8C3G4N4_CYCLU